MYTLNILFVLQVPLETVTGTAPRREDPRPKVSLAPYQKVPITIKLTSVPKGPNLLFRICLLLSFLPSLCSRQIGLCTLSSFSEYPSSISTHQTLPILQGFKCLLYFPHLFSETRCNLSLLRTSTELRLNPS